MLKLNTHPVCANAWAHDMLLATNLAWLQIEHTGGDQQDSQLVNAQAKSGESYGMALHIGMDFCCSTLLDKSFNVLLEVLELSGGSSMA